MPGAKSSMDALKAALASRQAKAQKNLTEHAESGQKWVKRGLLEQQRVEEYMEDRRREEERQKEMEEERLEKLTAHLTKKRKPGEEEEKPKLMEIDEALLDDDDAEPPISIDSLIERLREIGQPITLFGETDMQRYKRSRQIEKEMFEGKKNPDLLMLEQHQQKQLREEEVLAETLASTASQFDNEPVADDKSDSEDDDEERGMKVEAQAGGDDAPEPAKEAEEADVNVNSELMDRCDFIRSYIRKTMKAWEKDLADRPAELKITPESKADIAAHRQARRDIRPLQKRLRVYRLEGYMLDKIHPIVELAEQKEYREAAEQYLELTIGKAAWPIGVGCGGSMLMEDAIGLHDRFNRMDSRKDVAWALNDEVARKFVQALKRVMNKAQLYWPPEDPSKMAG